MIPPWGISGGYCSLYMLKGKERCIFYNPFNTSLVMIFYKYILLALLKLVLTHLDLLFFYSPKLSNSQYTTHISRISSDCSFLPQPTTMACSCQMTTQRKAFGWKQEKPWTITCWETGWVSHSEVGMSTCYHMFPHWEEMHYWEKGDDDLDQWVLYYY